MLSFPDEEMIMNAVTGILPASIKSSMSDLKERVLIADMALGIPEDERTSWDLFRCSAALTAQARGIIAERLVAHVTGSDAVCSSEGSGDIRLDGRCTEVKASFTKTKINIRQVRPWQDIDYVVLHVLVGNPKSCRAYRLTHDEMLQEVTNNGCASHGTKEAAAANANIEYSITISRGKRTSTMFTRWEKDYRDTELEAQLFS